MAAVPVSNRDIYLNAVIALQHPWMQTYNRTFMIAVTDALSPQSTGLQKKR
jgi:hypothetical protein